MNDFGRKGCRKAKIIAGKYKAQWDGLSPGKGRDK